MNTMGMCRMLRIVVLRRTKIIAVAVALMVCAAVYTYVSLQKDDLDPLSAKRRLREDQSVVRFQARLPGQRAEDAIYRGLDSESMGNDTMSGDPLNVARVAEYCNIPTDENNGEEGNAPPGYTLASVHVAIRHGDRTPMSLLLNVPRPQPQEGCVMNREALKRTSELRRFMYDMAVHKDKQPAGSHFAKWALFPQHKDCSSSQLTGRGALQHLHNGLALKEKYVMKWDLFGQEFDPSKQLNLWCTQYSRTYQSAVAFLYSFLPRFDITKLDIKGSLGTVFCHSKFIPQTCCNVLGKMKNAIERPPNMRGRKNPQFNHMVGPVAEVFDKKIKHLPYAAAIMDTLQGHACHSLRLPCGENGKCVTAAMMKNLWTLLDSDGKSLAADSKFDVYSRIAMRSLLLEITTDMMNVANNFTEVKFSLFSGHDITISPMLQALGLYDGKWPKYASRLVFELYRENSGKRDHFVRILFNGKDVTSLCRLCRHGLNSDGMCILKEFMKAVNNDADEIIGKHNLQSFCQSVQ